MLGEAVDPGSFLVCIEVQGFVMPRGDQPADQSGNTGKGGRGAKRLGTEVKREHADHADQHPHQVRWSGRTRRTRVNCLVLGEGKHRRRDDQPDHVKHIATWHSSTPSKGHI